MDDIECTCDKIGWDVEDYVPCPIHDTKAPAGPTATSVLAKLADEIVCIPRETLRKLVEEHDELKAENERLKNPATVHLTMDKIKDAFGHEVFGLEEMKPSFLIKERDQLKAENERLKLSGKKVNPVILQNDQLRSSLKSAYAALVDCIENSVIIYHPESDAIKTRDKLLAAHEWLRE